MRIDSHAPRVVELSVVGSELAEASDVLARRGELLNPMVLSVDHEHVAIVVPRDAGWSIELSRVAAMRTPRIQ